MQIFNSTATIKHRALEMLLTVGLGLIGLIAATRLDSVGASVSCGALAGFFVSYISDKIWPITGDSPDRRQWTLFFALLIVPCGIVMGGLLAYAVTQHNSNDAYFAAFVLAFLIYAPLQLRRVSKRASE